MINTSRADADAQWCWTPTISQRSSIRDAPDHQHPPPAAIRRFHRDQSDDLSQFSHICLSLLLSVISFIISASPHDVITHSRHSPSRWTLTSRTVQYTCSVTSGHHPHTQWAASDTRASNTTCCVLWYRKRTALLELHAVTDHWFKSQ